MSSEALQRVLDACSEQPRTTEHLADATGLQPEAARHALQRLRDAGIVHWSRIDIPVEQERADRLEQARQDLERRRVAMVAMRESGMKVKHIAQATGFSRSQIKRDLAAEPYHGRTIPEEVERWHLAPAAARARRRA